MDSDEIGQQLKRAHSARRRAHPTAIAALLGRQDAGQIVRLGPRAEDKRLVQIEDYLQVALFDGRSNELVAHQVIAVLAAASGTLYEKERSQ